MNIAYRWFCGYLLNEQTPHFSTLSRNFKHRFNEEVIEKIFFWILSEINGAGYLSPEAVFIDGTHIKANANMKKAVRKAVPEAAKVYEEQIKPNMRAGQYLMFAHGFNIHYKKIVPAKDINVIMVAPKGPGHTVRSQYVEGKGVPSLIAVYQDPTGDSKKVALSYAAAIGAGRAGIIETTFREETETDLFGEQAVICGGVSALMKAGFEVLTEAGYSPYMAYFEVLHEMKLIIDLVNQGGLADMRYSISNTAEYGDMTRGPKVIGEPSKNAMREILKDIQSGKFADEFTNEMATGHKKFDKLREENRNHEIEKIGEEIRSSFSWGRKENIIDRSKN